VGFFKLHSTGIVSAERTASLVVREEGRKPTAENRRLNFRVKPPPNCGLSVSLQGMSIAIVDIALGGMCISISHDIFLRHGENMTLTICIDDRQFNVLSKVIRVWFTQSQYFASLQFLGASASWESLLGEEVTRNTKRFVALLGQKIMHLERTWPP